MKKRIPILEKLRAQATSSKFQTPSSKEAPSSKLKTDLRAVCTGICFWGLVLGVSLSGGSKNEMPQMKMTLSARLTP